MQTDSIHYAKYPFTFDFLDQTLGLQANNDFLNQFDGPQPLVIGNNYLISQGPYKKHRIGKVYKYIRFGEGKLFFEDKDENDRFFERPFSFNRIYNGGVDSMEKIYIYPDREFQGEKITRRMSEDNIKMNPTNLFFGGVKSKKNLYRNGFYYNKRTKKSKKNKIHESLRFGKQPKVLKSKKSKKNKNYWRFHYKWDY